jgi:PAS domain S-box-containing protein
MQYQDKTKQQLIDELNEMRLKIVELKAARSTLVDIAELEQTVKDLKLRIEEQELLLNTIDTQIWYLTDPGTYGLVNQSRADFLGKRREEIEGKRLDDFYSHDVAAVCEVGNAEVFQSRRNIYTEEWIPNAAGEPRLISITKAPKLDEHGNVEYVVCAGTDITERKRTEEALRESKERFGNFLNATNDLVFIKDQHCRYVFVNKANQVFFGLSEEDIIGKTDFELIPQKLAEQCRESDQRAVAENDTVTTEESGTQGIFEVRKFPVRLGYQEVGVGAFIRDITERKQAEEALKRSEQRYRELTELLPQTVFETDMAGKLTFVNSAALKLTGYSMEEFLAANPGQLVIQEDRERFADNIKKMLLGQELVVDQNTLLKKDGTTVPVLSYAAPISENDKIVGVRGVVVDITSIKQAEEEREKLRTLLFQAQKMEALGTLVGGMAHDFNNMLQVILGYSQLLLEDKKEGELGYKDLQTIIQAGKGGADLVNKLLAFGQQAPIFPVDLDINYQIRGLIPLIFRTLPEIVKIDVDLTQEPTTIFADPNQIDQVVMNLAINASEAMPNGGQVKLATTTVTLNDEYCRSHSGVKPGKYVMLSLSDTGRGMDKEMLAKIFEPFFSTKQRGSTRGTGLGLSVVQGIVEKQGGHVTCESEPGKGSEFRIYFPAIESGSTTQEKTSSSAQIMPKRRILEHHGLPE